MRRPRGPTRLRPARPGELSVEDRQHLVPREIGPLAQARLEVRRLEQIHDRRHVRVSDRDDVTGALRTRALRSVLDLLGRDGEVTLGPTDPGSART
jgi:hypothetical protein